MKLSELKLAIREMIVGELSEGTYAGAGAEAEIKKDREFSNLPKASQDKAIQSLRKNDTVTLEEEQLDEMATFYKVKPEAGAEAKQAIAKAQEKFREGSALYNTLDLLKTKGEVDYKELAKVTGKDIATFNNPKSREVLEKDLAAFIDVAGGGKREAGSKEPKEPGMRGRPKGSKKPDDSLAYTMGGDVKVVGKTPTKSFIKRALKAANIAQPKASFNAKDLRALGIRDLDSMDMQIKDLSADLESKLAQAKEIAAKGSTKNYTPEEAEFMDDLRAKTELRKKLKASREALINKKIKKQDLDIDVVSTDED
jgi:hypothetical protein